MPHVHVHVHNFDSSPGHMLFRAVLFEDGWRPVDLMVDGNPYGQSALRFLAERAADQPADRSWLELSQGIPDNDDKVLSAYPVCVCAAKTLALGYIFWTKVSAETREAWREQLCTTLPT